jgi:hypothetical protein
MYGEIDARSEHLVKNGVIRCRSGERVSATFATETSYLLMDDSPDRSQVRLSPRRPQGCSK